MSVLDCGDLLWTRSDSLTGSLIRFGERVKHHGWWQAVRRQIHETLHRNPPEDPNDFAWGNHIAVYVGAGQLVEALAAGLVRRPASHYTPDQYRVLHLADVRPDVTDADRAAVRRFAMRELDDKYRYGWLAIASIVLQILTPTRLDLSVDGTMICSAFGARCWEHAGVTIPTLSPYTTMPSDLAVLALKKGAVR
jgi:hypothetical protein